MSETLKKEPKVIDNTQWKDRNQFVLSANGNIVCQRYFKVNGFNPAALHSTELYYTVRDIVTLIKKDLESKSRTYTAITNANSCKLTGFYQGEELSMQDAILAYSDRYRGRVELSNGTVLNKEYVDYPTEENERDERDNAPFIIKFSYLFDEKVVYEEAWDGSVYPRYVRNCIDLSNSNASYRYIEPSKMSFSQNMTKNLTAGHPDLIYIIIKMFCSTLSNRVTEDGTVVEKTYTTSEDYGGKKYRLDTYNRDYIRGWENAVRKKTVEYNRWVNWDLPQSKIDYINNVL